MMLSIYDYIVIAFYFLFMLAVGFLSRKFNATSKDYFVGGQRMCWWLVGSSLLVSGFSCWTFTGAAGVAAKYGIVILYLFIANAIGYLICYLFFAARFRQLRLITAMDGVRQRFGKLNEQVFNWLGLIAAPLNGGVGLFGLAIVLLAVLQPPDSSPEAKAQLLAAIIVVTGVVVTVMSMLGGSWAVVTSDFIQLLLIITIIVALAFAINFMMR